MRYSAKVLILTVFAGCGLPAAEKPGWLAVRLLTHLGSTGTANKAVVAVVTRPVIRDGMVVVPSGTLVRGQVETAKAVGLGLVRERALLSVRFDSWETPDGEQVPIKARLTAIDNSREEVDSLGRIQGILAARNAMGFARGVWHKPNANLFSRAATGFTGTSGVSLSNGVAGPIATVGVMAARIALTKFPEPEIHFAPGTDMTIRVDRIPLERTWGPAPARLNIDEDLARELSEFPAGVKKADGRLAGDVINVALAGSREKLQAAFLAAGWVGADPLTKRSAMRTYQAFTAREGYEKAPMSKLLLQGRAPDAVFQKSLNSVHKRHHIRFWRVEMQNGTEMWLGAATHDTGVTIDPRRFGLTHKIDAEIDWEREKVLDDLLFAGAIGGVGRVPRVPEAMPSNVGTITDGLLSFSYLQTPSPVYVVPELKLPKGRRALWKLGRRVILETRNFLVRDNVYYMSYEGARTLPFFRGSKADLTSRRGSSAVGY